MKADRDDIEDDDDDVDDSDDDDAGDGEESEPKSKSRSVGCLMQMAVIGALTLGGGIYFLARWNEIGAGSKAGAIILVVIGTLALLPPLIMLALQIFLKLAMRKFTKDFSNAADEIMKLNKGMYSQEHAFRPADDDDFEDVNCAFYDTTTQSLAEQGFRHLGDVVDKTIEENQGMTTPIRVLASPDASTQVGLYHFKFFGQDKTICDVTTEFSDGTFLMTSNTAGADQMTPPPAIARRQHPVETTPQELIRLHESEKQKLLAAKTGVTPVTVSTLADALASEKRQQQAKNAFRETIGYVDPEEVRRIGRELEDGSVISDKIADATDEARQREQR